MNSENDTSQQEFYIDKSQRLRGILIRYLDDKLQTFPKFFKQRFPDTFEDESEHSISPVLNTFLNTQRDLSEMTLFNFEREWKTSRSAVDFAVIDVKSFHETFEKPKPFFTIEAKRLPTPKDSKGKSREREYVEGQSGGIERYKKGKHGAGLPQSAIIGYVQKENCSHWHTKINEWIKDLEPKSDSSIQWNSSDLLKEIKDFGKSKKYHSKNTRIIDSKTDSIELHHYLIELN